MTDTSPRLPVAVRLVLRDVQDADLDVFFENSRDPVAVHMAAFTAEDPSDRAAFDAHWARIRAAESVRIRTIELGGEVVGSVLSYEQDGLPEVSYWIGRAHWGRGIATEALRRFLRDEETRRPVRARAARDNIGSIRVLSKCGFTVLAVERGFAAGRGEEVEELVLVRDA